MDFETIRHKVSGILEPLGFECHPFKIGWYNEKVMPGFHLSLDRDTLAFLIISTPAMFDQAFKPYICRLECIGESCRDLIDECIAHQFSLVRQAFPDKEVECIHDFELHHNRRPKVLVQTAGHVSGAAYYYQRTDVDSDPWPTDKKISGVSIHPRYGGWFSLRGVVIFKDVLVPQLQHRDPPDVVPDNRLRIELLERFNFRWRDWTFRDIVETAATYSEEQKLYFNTPPGQRRPLVAKIRAEAGLTDSNSHAV